MWFLLLLIIATTNAYPAGESSERDGEETRRILGSSVVTSVSVILDTGNGTQIIDAVGKPVPKPLTGTHVASPINLLNPDRYEFFTFDDNGELVKRLMTLEEIQGIIANGDGEDANYDSGTFLPEKKVNDVVSNVQSVLKEQIESHKNLSEAKPILDTPDVTSTWSMILPAIFSNNADNVGPDKTPIGVTADTIMIEDSTEEQPKPVEMSTVKTITSSATPTSPTEMMFEKFTTEQYIGDVRPSTQEILEVKPTIEDVKETETLSDKDAPLITVTIISDSKYDTSSLQSEDGESPIVSIISVGQEMIEEPTKTPELEWITGSTTDTPRSTTSTTMESTTTTSTTPRSTTSTTTESTTTTSTTPRTTTNTPTTAITTTPTIRPTTSTTTERATTIQITSVRPILEEKATEGMDLSTIKIQGYAPLSESMKRPVYVLEEGSIVPSLRPTVDENQVSHGEKLEIMETATEHVEEETSNLEGVSSESEIIQASASDVLGNLKSTTPILLIIQEKVTEKSDIPDVTTSKPTVSITYAPTSKTDKPSTIKIIYLTEKTVANILSSTTQPLTTTPKSDVPEEISTISKLITTTERPSTVKIVPLTEKTFITITTESSTKASFDLENITTSPPEVFDTTSEIGAVTESLNQLLLSSTNIYEINTQLAGVTAATDAEMITDEAESTEDETAKYETDSTTETYTTENSLMSSIQQLISQTVNDVEIEEQVMNLNANKKVENVLDEMNAKPMSDVRKEAATVGSMLMDNSEEDVKDDDEEVEDSNADEDENLKLSEAVSSVLSQIYSQGLGTTLADVAATEIVTPGSGKNESTSSEESIAAESSQKVITEINNNDSDLKSPNLENDDDDLKKNGANIEVANDEVLNIDQPQRDVEKIPILPNVSTSTVEALKNVEGQEVAMPTFGQKITTPKYESETSKVKEPMKEIETTQISAVTSQNNKNLEKSSEAGIQNPTRFESAQNTNGNLAEKETTKSEAPITLGLDQEVGIPQDLKGSYEKITIPSVSPEKESSKFEEQIKSESGQNAEIPVDLKGTDEKVDIADLSSDKEDSKLHAPIKFGSSQNPEKINDGKVGIANASPNKEGSKLQAPMTFGTVQNPEKISDEKVDIANASPDKEGSKLQAPIMFGPSQNPGKINDEKVDISDAFPDEIGSKLQAPMGSEPTQNAGISQGNYEKIDTISSQATTKPESEQNAGISQGLKENHEKVDATDKENPKLPIGSGFNENTKISGENAWPEKVTSKIEVPTKLGFDQNDTGTSPKEEDAKLDLPVKFETVQSTGISQGSKESIEMDASPQKESPKLETPIKSGSGQNVEFQQDSKDNYEKIDFTPEEESPKLNMPIKSGSSQNGEILQKNHVKIDVETSEMGNSKLTLPIKASTLAEESTTGSTIFGSTTSFEASVSSVKESDELNNSLPVKKNKVDDAGYSELLASIEDANKLPSTTLASITLKEDSSTPQPATSSLNIKNNDTSWTLVSTIAPHINIISSTPKPTVTIPTAAPVKLFQQTLPGYGLEDSTSKLDTDIYQFVELCNELSFGFWNAVTNGISSARSVFVSPFAATSLLAMVFLGARGATSGEMNEILRLDDMVTFNPHLIFKNVSESIEATKTSGVAVSVIARELYSDRGRGKLLSFYKERARQFYDGHVEEVNFKEVGDIIRRRTNLIVKKYTGGRIPEYLKDNSITMRPPLAGISASIFRIDCTGASTEGRDGELHFVVLPSVRQRRLVPIPAVVFRNGFLAGYDPGLDATAAAIGTQEQTISTILIIPGQQGIAAPGDGLGRLEKQLAATAFKKGSWSRLLRTLIPRPGLELQIPKFSHKSVINATVALQRMGLKDLFTYDKADLRGLNGIAHELHLSDILQLNNFATCGEGPVNTDQYHSEIYPATSRRPYRRNKKLGHYVSDSVFGDLEIAEEPRDYQRSFRDPLYDPNMLTLPLPLRPRQARIPDAPRLRFDRPFLFYVRHNPTGLILHMGRFNPRLLP